MRIILILLLIGGKLLSAQTFKKEKLLYSNELKSTKDTAGWRMEGAGALAFSDSGMRMFSPDQKGHHVLWCPTNFPSDFVAEWEVKNLHPQAGLCIVFFSAAGNQGEDLFDTKLPRRTGVFKQYTQGAIHNYHISYYANAKGESGRETAHLRKNPGFHLVQKGAAGIPIQSTSVHKISLSVFKGHIELQIDGRKVIDWQDDGQALGAVWKGGKFGFRQMQWTDFLYRNLKVWDIEQEDSK